MTDAERAELVRRLRNLNSHFDMKILGEAADAIAAPIAQNKPSPERVREADLVKRLIEKRDVASRMGVVCPEAHALQFVPDSDAVAIFDALAAEAPSGWVSVPREPTYEMVQAGAKLVKDNLPYHTGTKAIYKAMLSAIEAAPGEK